MAGQKHLLTVLVFDIDWLAMGSFFITDSPCESEFLSLLPRNALQDVAIVDVKPRFTLLFNEKGKQKKCING